MLVKDLPDPMILSREGRVSAGGCAVASQEHGRKLQHTTEHALEPDGVSMLVDEPTSQCTKQMNKRRSYTQPAAHSTLLPGDIHLDDPSHPPLHQELQLHHNHFEILQSRLETVCLDLHFEKNPTSLTESPVALSWKHSSHFLAHRNAVASLLNMVAAVETHGDESVQLARKLLSDDLEAYSTQLDRIVSAEWEKKKVYGLGFVTSNQPSTFVFNTDRLKLAAPHLIACLAMAVVLSVLSNVPHLAANFVLSAMKVVVMALCTSVVEGLGTRYNSEIHKVISAQLSVTENWPKDIRAIIQDFDLAPDVTTYACCTDCFSLYRPALLRGIPRYPTHCTFRETPTSRACNARLVHPDKVKHAVRKNQSDMPNTPLRPFEYQSLVSWIGRLLARPGIEKVIAETTASSMIQGLWNRTFRVTMRDVWDASIFREFKGQDQRPFCEAPAGEARLIFSLFVDWFNPFGNKQAGHNASVGAMYMALKKTAGLAAVTSKEGFCSFCLLPFSELANFDVKSWKRRTWKEHLESALAWRNAASETEHAAIYHKSWHHCWEVWGMNAGKKSTPKLEAHSPARQGTELEKGVAAIRKLSLTALTSLRIGYVESLALSNNIRLAGTSPTKKQHATAILEWFKANPNAEIRVPQVFPGPTANLSKAWSEKPAVTILGQDELKEVWSDLTVMVLPHWISRVLHNLGSPGHGKLKADQWQTACCIHLVITLVRIWGHLQPTERQRAVLDNFLALVAAVRWVTMCSSSENHAQIVETAFQVYLDGFVTLYTTDKLIPSHHLSLHLPECLRNFRPAHGWWAFPFERYNGILQQKNTNSKFGEMEGTFLRAFCQAGNLKALLDRERSQLPAILSEMTPLIGSSSASDIRGTLLTDLFALNDSSVPSTGTSRQISPDTYTLLLNRINLDQSSAHFVPHSLTSTSSVALNPAGLFLDRITIRGVTFRTDSTSVGDSLALFLDAHQKVMMAGQITSIFAHSQPGPDGKIMIETFLETKVFRDLSTTEQADDPYRRYPLLETFLVHDDFACVKVIKAWDIISHFASCPYTVGRQGHPFRVVVSLNRTSVIMGLRTQISESKLCYVVKTWELSKFSKDPDPNVLIGSNCRGRSDGFCGLDGTKSLFELTCNGAKHQIRNWLPNDKTTTSGANIEWNPDVTANDMLKPSICERTPARVWWSTFDDELVIKALQEPLTNASEAIAMTAWTETIVQAN
ncbi:hypothetical protein BU15DRAFT_67959 [Melanogaster broomeanus]|nr:hypothetical protein BU15DRAFT_67959 [Melanogaster broomeanus]